MVSADLSNTREHAPVTFSRQLLQKIRNDEELPALGAAISQVVSLASSGDEAVSDLARYILSDVALTQKILRLANTVTYRTLSGAPVTTVSRAIFLLGFDTVASSALAMLLVDGIKDRGHALHIYTELGTAMLASALAREMARRSPYKDVEEATIAALFKNLGRILVASHEHPTYEQVQATVARDKVSPAKAALDVMGCSFDMLGLAVLKEWKIPDSITATLAPLSTGRLRTPRQRQEWLQQVVAFSSEAALLATAPEDMHSPAAQQLLARYGDALALDPERVRYLLDLAIRETRVLMDDIAIWLDVPGKQASAAEVEPCLLDDLLLAGDSSAMAEVTTRYASGKPVNARDLLLAGMQEVMQTMASHRCTVNDLMLLVLETLSKSLGFRFAAICLKDAQGSQFRARMAIGEDHVSRQAGFQSTMTASPARDLFQLALKNNVDLLISDATEPKISALIPAWHRALLPDTRSFIVLPLVVKDKPVGFFYADRVHPAPEGVPPDETSLIKTLKGQVLIALQRPYS